MASSRRKQKGEDFKQEDVLQAVVIADSFNIRFAPVTKHKPRTLLPLASIPLLEYTLEFLCSSGIQEVILFCCAHANQIKAYLNSKESKWGDSSCPMDIVTVVSDDCLSVGDALRDIDAKSLITNDFVLVSGDMVSNVQLKPIIEEHKARRLKDKSVIMTMLFKKAPPGHMIRCKEDEVVMAIEPNNQRVLSYQKMGNVKQFDFPLDMFTSNKHVQLRYDLLDCHICICSPHVPPLFTDNFDFLTTDDFVRGILVDEEILGNSIHIHDIEAEYAARVSNLLMYDAISKDVLNRWVYPMVPDNAITEQSSDKYSYARHNIYLHQDVTLARGCTLHENVLIGKGSSISENTSISHSVIGQNCTIGENVKLEGVYMWDGVTIDSNCILTTCVIDNDARLKKNVKVLEGCVVGMNVVVGPDITLNPGTLLSCDPPENDFDDEVEDPVPDTSVVGEEGRGFVYKPLVDSDDEADVITQDIWGSKADSDYVESEDTDSDEDSDQEGRDSPLPDEPKLFYGEVISTLERARDEGISKDNMVLEINSVKHAYGIQIKEVNHFLTRAIMELPLVSNPKLEPTQYLSQIKSNFDKIFMPLLRNYIRNDESQMDCMVSLEEFSLSSPVVQRSLVNVVHFLYEKDLLTEDVVLRWHSMPCEGAEDAATRRQIRQQVNPFIKWLKEAEEESEDEDSEEDSDD